MPRAEPHAQGRHRRDEAVLARDAALTRVRRTRGWTIAAAAALTAALTALASALVPGRSLGARLHEVVVAPRTSTPPAGRLTIAPPLPAAASAAQLGISGASQSQSQPSAPTPPPPPAPAQAPAPTPAPVAAPPAPATSAPVVVSGGS